MLALTAESKLLLVVLWTGVEGKTLARSIVAYEVPEDMLICSSNKTTSGTAAAIGVTTWLNL